jgi:hypothetical protein
MLFPRMPSVSDPLTSTSQVAGIRGVPHHTWPPVVFCDLFAFYSICDSSMLVHRAVITHFYFGILFHYNLFTTLYLTILVLKGFAMFPVFAVSNHGTYIVLSLVPMHLCIFCR